MIDTDRAILLQRQDLRETDIVVSLYTFAHGKLHARLPGVKRAGSKLKALGEPLTCADYRLYTKRGGIISTVTGGKIVSVFPTVRRNLARTTLALHCVELVARLTPLHQPSPQKFELLLQALSSLDCFPPTPAFTAAFTLRLMMLAGFGLDHPVLRISEAFWQRMHEDDFKNLIFEDPQELLFLARCNTVVRRFLDRYLTYPLHTTKPIGLQDTFATPALVVHGQAL